MVIPQGVKLGAEPQTKVVAFDNTFTKKSNMGPKVFIGVAVVLLVAIVGWIVVGVLKQ
jgi:hypothetical protein